MANDVLANLSVQISAQTAQMGAALKLLESQLNRFGASVNAQSTAITGFEKRIQGIQRSLGSLGIAFGVFQIANVIRGAISTIADFEKQISIVSAISGATGESLKALENDALRLGASTKFTATQVAELQTELGRLGFTTSEILNATEAITKLSIATGEDLAASASVVGNVVRAFNLDASEATRVVDVMASSFNKSALALDNFAESMKYVAPIAASANISVEETTALLGVLADAGIRGSQAGTGLRRIITDLAKDGRPLAVRLQELADKGLTFGGAMDEVGRFAQAALLVLTKNTGRISTFTEELNTASGTADGMAAIMEDNLNGAFVRLTSALDGFILTLKGSSGPLRDFVENLTTLVNLFTDISNFVNGEGNELSKIFKFLFDVSPVGLFNKAFEETIGLYRRYSDGVKEAEKAQKELADKEKQRAIESTVNAAFASGNIEAYIKALDQNIYKEEIIAEIRKRQNEELAKQADAIINQVGIIQALENRVTELQGKIKSATSIEAIRTLSRELEGVKLRIESILNPSVAPEAISIPVTFDLKLDENLAEQIRNLDVTTFSQTNLGGIVVPVDVEMQPEDTSFADDLADNIKAKMEEIREAFSSLVTQGLGDTIAAFAEDLGNVAAGVGSFGDNILKAVAGFAKQFGRLLIATGLAKIAFDKIRISGVGAVVAGAALIAAAQAVTAHLGTASQAVAGGGSGASAAASTPSNFQTERAAEQIVVINGEFKVRGTELVQVIDNTTRRTQRTG